MPNSQNVSSNKGSSQPSGRPRVKVVRPAEPKTATARNKLPIKQDGYPSSSKGHNKSSNYGLVTPVGQFSAYEGRPQEKARPTNGRIARSTSHTVYSKDASSDHHGSVGVRNNINRYGPSVTKQCNPSTAHQGPHLNLSGTGSTRNYPHSTRNELNAKRSFLPSTRKEPNSTHTDPSSNRYNSTTLFDPCERQRIYTPSYRSPYNAGTNNARRFDSKETHTSGYNPSTSASRHFSAHTVGNNIAINYLTRNNNQQTDALGHISSNLDNGNSSYQNLSRNTTRTQSKKPSRKTSRQNSQDVVTTSGLGSADQSKYISRTNSKELNGTSKHVSSRNSQDNQTSGSNPSKREKRILSFELQERQSNPASRQTSQTGRGLRNDQTTRGSVHASYENVSNPVAYEQAMVSKRNTITGGIFGKLVGRKETIQPGPEACTVNMINRPMTTRLCPQYCRPTESALSPKRDYYIESRNTAGTTVFIRPPCTIPNSGQTYIPMQFASKQKQNKEVSKPDGNYVSKASQKRLTGQQRPKTPPCAQFENQRPLYEHCRNKQQPPFAQFGNYQPPFGVMGSPNRVKSPQRCNMGTPGVRTRNEFDCKQTRSLFNPDCASATFGKPEPPSVQFGNQVPSLYHQPHFLSPPNTVKIQHTCRNASPRKRRRTEFDCKQTKPLYHPDCSTRQVPNGSARLKKLHTARFPELNTVACKKDDPHKGKNHDQSPMNCRITLSGCNQTNQLHCGNPQGEYNKTNQVPRQFGNSKCGCNQTNQLLKHCGNLQGEYNKTNQVPRQFGNPQSGCYTSCGGPPKASSSVCKSPFVYDTHTRSLDTGHVTHPNTARYKDTRDRFNEFPNEGNRFKDNRSKVRSDWMVKKDNEMVDEPSCPAGRFGQVEMDNIRPELADYFYDRENFTGDRTTGRDPMALTPSANGPHQPPASFQYHYSSAGPCLTNKTRKQRMLNDCIHNLRKDDCELRTRPDKDCDKVYEAFLEGECHRRHVMEEGSVRYHTRYEEETTKTFCPRETYMPPRDTLKQTTLRPISIPKKADTEFGRYVNDVLHPDWENDETCKRNLKFIVKDPSHFQLRPDWNKNWIFNKQHKLKRQKRITEKGGTSSGAKDRFLSSKV